MNWIAEEKAEQSFCPFKPGKEHCSTYPCLAWEYYEGTDQALSDSGAGRCRLIP